MRCDACDAMRCAGRGRCARPASARWVAAARCDGDGDGGDDVDDDDDDDDECFIKCLLNPRFDE